MDNRAYNGGYWQWALVGMWTVAVAMDGVAMDRLGVGEPTQDGFTHLFDCLVTALLIFVF